MNMKLRKLPAAALRILCAASAAMVAACGQTGDLYLPDSRQGTVVTRPAPVPGGSSSPNDTPGTVDSPPAPEAPAPEVAPPPGSDGGDAQNSAKKKKNGASPR